MLKDIFASRSGNQIALVVFDMDQVLRDRILGQLPDVLKETVIEEIDALNSNEENKVQNTKKSKIAKDEIAKTLLKMYRDGILKFEESPVEGGAANSGSAVA
jgi:predicted transcriptional regulator